MTDQAAALKRRMIEAMARAIYAADPIPIPTMRGGWLTWDQVLENTRQVSRQQAEAALTAQSALLKELGLKIVGRELDEDVLSTDIPSKIPAHEYQADDPLMWPQRRWVWKCLHDAAPTTPWEAKDGAQE